MLTPPDPISGPAASTAAYERLRQFAIANSLTSGNGGGGLRKAFGGGSVFALPERKRNRPSLGGPVSTHPFKLSEASAGATLKVRIKFGMVNSLTPGGMGDVAEPDLILTFSGTASKYVILDVTTDASGTATAATISLATAVPAATETHGYIALGLITYTAATSGPPATAEYITCNQSVSGSLAHMMCGTTTHLFGSV